MCVTSYIITLSNYWQVMGAICSLHVAYTLCTPDFVYKLSVVTKDPMQIVWQLELP